MTRPAFAEILDLSTPFAAIANDHASADKVSSDADNQLTEVEKFIARRKRQRKGH